MEDQGSGLVLVLEDNFSVSNYLEALVKSMGYRCSATDNIAQAREILANNEVYAAVLDNTVRGVQYGPPLRDVGLNLALELRKTNPKLLIALHTNMDFEMGTLDYLASQRIRYLQKLVKEKDMCEFLQAQ